MSTPSRAVHRLTAAVHRLTAPSIASQRLRVCGPKRLKAPGSFTRRRRKPSGTCAICATDAIHESGTESIKQQSLSPYRTAGCWSRRGLHEIPLRPSASPFWCRRPLFFGSLIRKPQGRRCEGSQPSCAPRFLTENSRTSPHSARQPTFDRTVLLCGTARTRSGGAGDGTTPARPTRSPRAVAIFRGPRAETAAKHRGSWKGPGRERGRGFPPGPIPRLWGCLVLGRGGIRGRYCVQGGRGWISTELRRNYARRPERDFLAGPQVETAGPHREHVERRLTAPAPRPTLDRPMLLCGTARTRSGGAGDGTRAARPTRSPRETIKRERFFRD